MFRIPQYLLLIAGLLSYHVSHAQNVIGEPKLEYAPKTPEVAAMQQFVDVPMSYFTGQPDITVPLVALVSKSLPVNVTLAYQGGGIKADQQTGTVGLGWSLQYGGMISRTVRGNPDEGIRIYTGVDTIITMGDTAFVKSATTLLWETYRKDGGFYVDKSSNMNLADIYNAVLAHNNNPNSGLDGLELFTAGFCDGEPDMFYFNFEGHSGKFFYNRGEPTLIPYNTDLKIITNFHSGIDSWGCTDNYFDSFIILTPEGKEYHFGETPESKVSADVYNVFEKPNAWALTRVIDRNTKDTVYYDYLRKQSHIRKPAAAQKIVTPADFSSCIVPVTGTALELFYESRLMKIRTRNEEIRFYYSDILEDYVKTQRLDSIRVFDKETQTPYRKMQFDYSKFKSRRLKLNSCVVSDGNNEGVMPYQFQYYDTAFQKHPTRTTEDFYSPYSQDFWGYYNDNTGNETAGSLNIRDGCTNNGSRNSAWPQMQRDALLAITYPTGGKTSFEYEPHDFSTARMMNGNIGDADTYQLHIKHNFTISSIVGGLRVKRILTYDPIAKDTLVKRMSYKRADLPSHSSGHLYISPSLIASASSPLCGPVPVDRIFLSTYNMVENVSGDNHIGYSNVRVFEESSGVAKGYTDYEYYTDINTDSAFYFNLCDSAAGNICYTNNYDIYPGWLPVKHRPNLLNGMEKSKKVYAQTNQLLQEEKTNYKSIKYKGISRAIVTFTVLKNEICNPPSGVGSYNPPPNAISRILAPNLSLYFLHSYVMGKMAVLPEETITIQYNAAGMLADTIRYSYESPYHINPTKTTKTNSRQESVVSETVYGFDFTDGTAPDSTFLYMKRSYFNPPVAAFTYKNTVIASGGYRKYFRAPADTSRILPVEEYAVYTATGESPAALNLASGYPKPFAFTPAKFDKAASFVYDTENNIIQVEQRGGKRNAMLWDPKKNNLLAEAVNAASPQMAYTSFELSSNGGWNVSSAARVAGGLTGKKAYGLSNGAVSVTSIPSGSKYIVSYWSSGAAANVNGVAAVAGATRQGWTYYEHVLPNTTSAVSVTGSVNIDELRLYPADAKMNTYVYEPMLGVSSISTDNNIQFFDYDKSGRLLYVRDAGRNVLKANNYFYTGYGHSSPVWLGTGVTRCKPCDLNSTYNANILQLEQVDMNPGSSTYGSKRWFDNGVSASCSANAVWQNTATAVRCKKNIYDQNTGEQEQEQKDMNPCSPTYNTTRWVVTGTNTTVCPVCIGNDKKIINGICETGNRVNLSSEGILVNGQTKYKCTYRYEWSDCSKSANFEEIANQPCTLNTSCDEW